MYISPLGIRGNSISGAGLPTSWDALPMFLLDLYVDCGACSRRDLSDGRFGVLADGALKRQRDEKRSMG